MSNLKALRMSLGLKQSELAAQLKIAQSTLSGWENEKFEIDNENLFKLADIFGVSIDYLLGKTDDKKPPVSKMDTSGDAALANASAETKTIMGLLNQLDPESRKQALDHLDYLLARQDALKDKK